MSEDGSVGAGEGDESQDLCFCVGERKKLLQALQVAAERGMKEQSYARLRTQAAFQREKRFGEFRWRHRSGFGGDESRGRGGVQHPTGIRGGRALSCERERVVGLVVRYLQRFNVEK